MACNSLATIKAKLIAKLPATVVAAAFSKEFSTGELWDEVEEDYGKVTFRTRTGIQVTYDPATGETTYDYNRVNQARLKPVAERVERVINTCVAIMKIAALKQVGDVSEVKRVTGGTVLTLEI